MAETVRPSPHLVSERDSHEPRDAAAGLGTGGPDGASPSNGADTDISAYEGRDALLICLKEIALRLGRPSSETVLLAGLPLQNGYLAVDTFARAADRIGLDVEPISGDIRSLTGSDLPALIWGKSGKPLLLTERHENRTFSVFKPEDGSTSIIHVDDLAKDVGREQTLRVTPRIASIEEDRPTAPPENWLWRAAKPYWRTYAHLAVSTTFINLLALALPLFTMTVYDRVMPNKALPTLWVLAVGIVLAILFDFLLRTIRAHLIDHVGRQIDLKISSLLIERILNTRLSARSATTGIVTQRLGEYEFLREFLTSNTLIFFIDLLFSGLFLVFIATIALELVIAPVIVLAIMIGVGLILQRVLGRELARVDVVNAQRQSLMVEMVGGLETIKSSRAEGYFLRRWDGINNALSRRNQRIKNYSSLAANLAYLFQLVASVCVIVTGVYLFDAGTTTSGGIVGAMMLVGRAIAPFGQVALMLSRVRQAVAAYHTLDKLMATEDERADRRLLVSRSITDGRIEFRQLGFAYAPGGQRILNRFSLTIAPGERVAILGRVGVGKTTVGRLLVRFYEAQEGEILIDGIDLRQYHPHEIRRQINFVPQDPDLFYGSIRENLLMANPSTTDEELVAAARLAGLDQFVSGHPLGYDLPTGERGALLSSGQRQMVGLARAFLARGKVLFLDDPTNSMDLATERLFVGKLQDALTTGQTLVLTTHRNALLAIVDRLVVIEDGAVAIDGPRDVVLRSLAERQVKMQPAAVSA